MVHTDTYILEQERPGATAELLNIIRGSERIWQRD
jgi:hypothetical protein